jgi:hypothetical protein
LILEMLKMVNSLRSSLSKNALIFMREMAVVMPKCVDTELFTILPGIMRKCIDTNIFLAEEADQTLIKIASNCMESKVVSALLQYSNVHNKTALSKAKTALAFNVIVERMGATVVRLKDINSFLATLINYSSNASPDVRHEARKAIQALAA